MERTEVSVTTRTVSTASHEGWTLTFNHESNGSQNGVSCNGTNGTGGVLNASLNGSNSNISFNGVAHDSDLAADIFAELETILTGGE